MAAGFRLSLLLSLKAVRGHKEMILICVFAVFQISDGQGQMMRRLIATSGFAPQLWRPQPSHAMLGRGFLHTGAHRTGASPCEAKLATLVSELKYSLERKDWGKCGHGLVEIEELVNAEFAVSPPTASPKLLVNFYEVMARVVSETSRSGEPVELSKPLKSMMNRWLRENLKRLHPALAPNLFISVAHLGIESKDILNRLVLAATCSEAVKQLDTHSLVALLLNVSRVSTRGVSLPPLDSCLLKLGSEIPKLSATSLVKVLSLLTTLRENRHHHLLLTVATRLAHHDDQLNCKDAVQAIRFIANSPVPHLRLASRLLVDCTRLVPDMSTWEVSEMCRSLYRIHKVRTVMDIPATCSVELRYLFIPLVRRIEGFHKTLSYNEAKSVLRCLEVYKVRHGVLFSYLTPFVNLPE